MYWWYVHDLVSASRDTDFVAARLRVFFCMISFMFFLVLRVESVSFFCKIILPRLPLLFLLLLWFQTRQGRHPFAISAWLSAHRLRSSMVSDTERLQNIEQNPKHSHVCIRLSVTI